MNIMKLIKEEIWIKPLNRKARLYIGLPNSYDSSNKSYPVLYMHDGHNVFLKEDAFIGETWQMLEAYDYHSKLPEIIVVALDSAQNGFDRISEYSPFKLEMKEKEYTDIKPQGRIYLTYLVNELKPMIDLRFRTKTGKLDTAIMGSSMGGIISLYAGLKYPNVFGKVASVSGAYFISPESFYKFISHTKIDPASYFYIDTGDQENALEDEHDYVKHNSAIYNFLSEKVKDTQLDFEIIIGGQHNEVSWAKRLPRIINKLFQ